MNQKNGGAKLREGKIERWVRHRAWNNHVDETVDELKPRMKDGSIDENNFEAIFEQLFSAIWDQGIPVSRRFLYEKYNKAFGKSQKEVVWEQRLENFKEMCADVKEWAGMGAIAVAVLATLVGGSVAHQKSVNKSWDNHKAAIAQEHVDTVDRIFAIYAADLAYDENFSKGFVKGIYNDYLDQGYDAAHAARLTEGDLQKKKENDKWNDIYKGFEEWQKRQVDDTQPKPNIQNLTRTPEDGVQK